MCLLIKRWLLIKMNCNSYTPLITAGPRMRAFIKLFPSESRIKKNRYNSGISKNGGIWL